MKKYSIRIYGIVFIIAMALAVVMGTVFNNTFLNIRDAGQVEIWELIPDEILRLIVNGYVVEKYGMKIVGQGG